MSNICIMLYIVQIIIHRLRESISWIQESHKVYDEAKALGFATLISALDHAKEPSAFERADTNIIHSTTKFHSKKEYNIS